MLGGWGMESENKGQQEFVAERLWRIWGDTLLLVCCWREADDGRLATGPLEASWPWKDPVGVMDMVSLVRGFSGRLHALGCGACGF